MAKERFSNPQEMKLAIDQFFLSGNGGKFPSLSAMLINLGLTEDEYAEYMDGRHKYQETYRKIGEMALLKRKSWLEQAMIDDPKSTSACIHLLKQPENGGQDPELQKNKGTKIIHKIDGLQGESLSELFG